MDDFGFGFGPEQEEYRQVVRRFATARLARGAADRARSDVRYPPELIKAIADVGILGLNISEDYGGQGDTGYLAVGIATEEIARADFNAPNPINAILIGKVLERWASEDVKQKYLTALVRGEMILALGLTEPQAGSDAAALATTAVRDGSDYILNGTKASISRAPYASAAIIFAKTDPAAGARGVTTFLVPLDAPGVTVAPIADTGWRPSGRGMIYLDNVRLPAGMRIGDEGQGFRQVMNGFDFSRACLGLQALGAAATTLDEAAAYAKERTTFGRPLIKNESISFKFAEHWTKVEAARLLCYRTLWLRDHGLPHTKEAAMCKWWAPRVAYEAIHDSLLVYGNVAYSTEFPIEQRLRDVMALEIADGTADIMKIIISREILGRESLPY